MIAALILAAGASRRMQGRDKLMEMVDGVPLLRRQTARVLATGAPVWVALPAAPHPRHTALDGLEVTRVPVSDASEGMNASLRAGLGALPDGVEAAMIVLADMPDLSTNDFNNMLQAVDLGTDIRIWQATTETGRPGHPVIFHAALFPELRALEGDGGARAVVQAHQGALRKLPLPADHAYTDLDTPQAWADWRKGSD